MSTGSSKISFSIPEARTPLTFDIQSNQCPQGEKPSMKATKPFAKAEQEEVPTLVVKAQETKPEAAIFTFFAIVTAAKKAAPILFQRYRMGISVAVIIVLAFVLGVASALLWHGSKQHSHGHGSANNEVAQSVGNFERPDGQHDHSTNLIDQISVKPRGITWHHQRKQEFPQSPDKIRVGQRFNNTQLT